MLGFIAVKNSTSDEMLDVIFDYYKNHDLVLIEERIGNRISKYSNSIKSYTNLQEYEKDAYPPTRPNFTTNFDVLENLEDVSKEWKIIYFYPDYPINSSDVYMAINVNCELSKFLSEKLQKQILQYANIDTLDYYKIRLYDNGKLVDYLETTEGEILSKKGHFETLDSNGSIFSQVEKYLKDKGFGYIEDFDNNLNENQRRPLYLKGSPENILRFFQYQGKLE